MDDKKVEVPKKVQPVAANRPVPKKIIPKKAMAAKPAPAAKPTITKEESKELAKGVKPLSPLGSL